METRRLGRTEHKSTIVALGGFALAWGIPDEAERLVELVLAHGVNHIDVAPGYVNAEVLLGPAIEKHRKRFFLACKTQKRTRAEAWEELKRSLDRLRTDHFDLYQFHGVSDLAALEAILAPGGAMETFLEAKQQGLIRFIGITGHSPRVHVAALERFDFDTVLFPLNRVIAAYPSEYGDYEPLLRLAKERDVGAMAIKAIAKRPWPGAAHRFQTWYQPYDTQAEIDASLWFTLSHDIATTAMAGDLRLVPLIVDAAERFHRLSTEEREKALAEARAGAPIFPRS